MQTDLSVVSPPQRPSTAPAQTRLSVLYSRTDERAFENINLNKAHLLYLGFNL